MCYNNFMTLRGYLFLMTVATLIAGAIFALTGSLVNPFTTNGIGFFLFYASLFLTVMGVAAIIGFIVRFGILKKHLADRAVTISFRQAFLVASLINIALILAAHKLFSWFNILLLIIAFSTLEFFLISLGGEEG